MGKAPKEKVWTDRQLKNKIKWIRFVMSVLNTISFKKKSKLAGKERFITTEEGNVRVLTYNMDNQAIISGQNYQIKVKDFWKSYDIEVWENRQLVARYQEDIGSEFSYQVDFFGETIKKADWIKVNQHELEFLKNVLKYTTST